MTEQHVICTEKETLGSIKATLEALDKRINGSYETFNNHIIQGRGWRGAVIGTAVMVIMQIIMFAYVYGNLSKTVNVNERILQREILNGEMHNRSVQ